MTDPSKRTFQYNNGYQNTYPFHFVSSGNRTTALGTNSVNDPQFVGPTTSLSPSNFRLKGTSPRRDEIDGTYLAGLGNETYVSLTTDYFNNPRVGKNDGGALETVGISSITPGAGANGSTMLVTITGSNFDAALTPTVVVSGSNVTVSNVQVVNATTLTAVFTIANGLDIQAHDVTVTVGGDSDTLVGAFKVVCSPTPTSITPNQIVATNSDVALTIRGICISFLDIYEVELIDPLTKVGYTLKNVVTSGSDLEGNLSETGLQPGLYDIKLTGMNAIGVGVGKGLFRITAKPVVSSISPNPIYQGIGNGTSFTVKGVFNAGDKYNIRLDNGTTVIFSTGTALDGTTLAFKANFPGTETTGKYTVAVRNTVDLGIGGKTGLLVVNPKPVIDQITPGVLLTNTSGNKVTLSGSGFQASAQVTASNPNIKVTVGPISATTIELTIDVPQSVANGAYQLTVTNPDGGSAQVRLAIGTDPAIGSLSPSASVGGVTSFNVVIKGANFTGTSPVVDFGAGITVNKVTWNSSTQVTVNINVSVTTTPGERTVVLIDNLTALKATAKFTVLPRPTLTSVTPAVVGQNSSHVLVLTGTGFDPAAGVSVVLIGGVTQTAEPEVLSTTEIQLAVTIAPDAALGFRGITVINKNPRLGGGFLENALEIVAAPTISGVAVNGIADRYQIGQGASLSLVLEGTNFSKNQDGTPNVEVTFYTDEACSELDESIEIESYAFDSGKLELQLAVDPTAPLGNRCVKLVNKDNGGTASWVKSAQDDRLEVTPRPHVDSIEPLKVGRGAKGFTVTIKGKDFPAQSDATLDFGNGISATVQSVSQDGTTLVATLDVTGDADLGQTTLRFINELTGAQTSAPGIEIVTSPSGSEVAPTTLKTGTNAANVTVIGADFDENVEVTLGSSGVTLVPNSLVRISATQLTFQVDVAANATLGPLPITILNKDTGGSVTLADKLTVTQNQQPQWVDEPTDQTLNINEPFELTIRATDPDNDPLTLTAGDTLDANKVKVDGPTFTSNGSSSGTYGWTPTKLGTYTVELKVDDGSGGTLTKTITLTVVDPPAQITLPENPRCVDGQTFTYLFEACDPQNQALTVTVKVTVSNQTQELTATKVGEPCSFSVDIPCQDGMTVDVLANDGTTTATANFPINVSFNSGPGIPAITSPTDKELVAALVVSFTNAEEKTLSPASRRSTPATPVRPRPVTAGRSRSRTWRRTPPGPRPASSRRRS